MIKTEQLKSAKVINLSFIINYIIYKLIFYNMISVHISIYLFVGGFFHTVARLCQQTNIL
jgi:hypothetical protein